MKKISAIKAGKKFKKYSMLLIAYLTIAGIYSFSAFILEEAQQQIIWATWPAKDSGDYELVLEGADLLQSLNTTLWCINWSIGYIQPLALLSYHSYWRSTDYYIRSMKAMIFANSPQTLINRKIEFMFTPQKIVQENGIVTLINRQVRVITNRVPETKSVKISGIVRVENNLIIIKDSNYEKNRRN
jgi:filamentous hemagglutinin family protein